MNGDLAGKKIAFLVANSGVEQIELTRPWDEARSAGADTRLLAPQLGQVQGFHHDVERADQFPVDAEVGHSSAGEYEGLVLPGGTTNADRLRLVPEAVAFVRSFVAAAKPVAAICHGPWALVEADVVRGKTLTSYPSLQTDIRNAGGSWVDKEIFVCPGNGWELVTSRKPDDLDAFCAAMLRAFMSPAGIGP
ncbi:MAG TPA: type 1 glutamine amidotransferase domain-containing protein [Mycobacteriales bacterium]|jgi:protease I|nr:type 1 glutamine amidotransferase domain-containing protein [Mycobacteriales bacterium]